MNNIVKILIDKLKSKTPKLYNILSVVALVTAAALGTFQATEYGSAIPTDTYVMLYALLALFAGGVQLKEDKGKPK